MPSARARRWPARTRPPARQRARTPRPAPPQATGRAVGSAAARGRRTRSQRRPPRRRSRVGATRRPLFLRPPAPCRGRPRWGPPGRRSPRGWEAGAEARPAEADARPGRPRPRRPARPWHRQRRVAPASAAARGRRGGTPASRWPGRDHPALPTGGRRPGPRPASRGTRRPPDAARPGVGAPPHGRAPGLVGVPALVGPSVSSSPWWWFSRRGVTFGLQPGLVAMFSFGPPSTCRRFVRVFGCVRIRTSGVEP